MSVIFQITKYNRNSWASSIVQYMLILHSVFILIKSNTQSFKTNLSHSLHNFLLFYLFLLFYNSVRKLMPKCFSPCGIFKLYIYSSPLIFLLLLLFYSPFSIYHLFIKSPWALLLPPQNLFFQSKTQEVVCKPWSHHHWCA